LSFPVRNLKGILSAKAKTKGIDIETSNARNNKKQDTINAQL